MLIIEDILLEAKISNKNVKKVISIINRLITKKTGIKTYPFGGEDHDGLPVKGGRGYLYFLSTSVGTRGLRYNYVNGELTSLSIWRKFKLGTLADFTITFDGLNLVSVATKIVDLILNTKKGEWAVYQPIGENVCVTSEDFLTEEKMKRVSPEEFAVIISKNLFAGENLKSLSFDRIQELAILSGVNVPTIIRQKGKVSGKGKSAKFDVTLSHLSQKDSGEKTKVPNPNAVEPIYYVKVTAQDPHTKKFLSVKDDATAQAMTGKIAQTLNNPDVKKEMKDPNSLFGIMNSLVKLVAKGNRNSLIVYGGPGTGKTFTVTQTLDSSGLVKNKDWFHFKGKMTTASLYQTLFMLKNGKVLLFDDMDSVWGDQEAVNILKAALDSYDTRMISWVSNRTTNVSGMDDGERHEYIEATWDRLKADPTDTKIKLPSEFEFKGRIIFISNLAFEKFDSAVLTRSAKIDMTLTPDQMFHRIESILEHLGDKSVPFDQKKFVLDFIKQRYIKGEISGSEISMRTFVAAEDCYKSGLPDWKDLLDYV